MTPVIALIVTGLISTGVIMFALKVLRNQASKSVGKERDIIREEIDRHDAAISTIVEKLQGMVSYDEVAKLQGQRAAVAEQVAVEKEKVKKLERDLEVLQGKVDKQEARHNELKKGKEDAEQIADELRASKDLLLSEFNRLESELTQSRQQMDTLSSELNLTAEQQNALNEVKSSVDKMQKQLVELANSHTHSATRFSNLQMQYAELEKEYRKLIDKELSGG